MKMMRSVLFSLAACGLVLGLTANLQAQSTVQGQATVVKMKGEARFTDGKSGWRQLKIGDVLSPGCIVQTETTKRSYVDLVLNDPFTLTAPTPVAFNPMAPPFRNKTTAYQPPIEQNVLRLWENTIVGIDKLSAQQTGADVVTDTQLDLKAGHIMGTVKKMPRGARYEIKLPKGYAGIRGTEYELWANGSGAVRVGSMHISLLDDQDSPFTVALNGGEMYDAPTKTKSFIPGADVVLFDESIADLKVTQTGSTPPQVLDTTLVQFISSTKGKGQGHEHGNGNGNGNGTGDH
jgi:hypothetical protein